MLDVEGETNFYKFDNFTDLQSSFLTFASKAKLILAALYVQKLFLIAKDLRFCKLLHVGVCSDIAEDHYHRYPTQLLILDAPTRGEALLASRFLQRSNVDHSS